MDKNKYENNVMQNLLLFWLLYLCLLLLPAGLAAQALPIKNFHAVDSMLYRSAQPKAKGFKALEQEDITTVINLRRYWKDNRKVSKASNIQPIHIPVKIARSRKRIV